MFKEAREATYRFFSMPLCPHTRGQLHNTGDQVRKLVGDDGRHKKEEDGGVQDASTRSWGAKDGQVSISLAKPMQNRTVNLPSVLAPNVARLAVHNPVDQREEIDENQRQVVGNDTCANTDQAEYRYQKPEE